VVLLSAAVLVALAAVLLVVLRPADRPGGGAPAVPAGKAGNAGAVAVPPASFAALASAALEVDPAGGGSPRKGCVAEALTEAERETGLMGRRDLGGYIGMAFVFPAAVTERFWMKDTLIPLDVAWFAADGRFVGEASMSPCPASTVSCPTYGPGFSYTLALEVPRGGLAALGIGPGSSVHLGGSCAAT
jgi:uncharacterized membrane protein (UPF0127 family)